MDGDEKVELNSRTVLTDARTKDLMTPKDGGMLGGFEGLRATIEVKDKTATSVTLLPKKK